MEKKDTCQRLEPTMRQKALSLLGNPMTHAPELYAHQQEQSTEEQQLTQYKSFSLQCWCRAINEALPTYHWFSTFILKIKSKLKITLSILETYSDSHLEYSLGLSAYLFEVIREIDKEGGKLVFTLLFSYPRAFETSLWREDILPLRLLILRVLSRLLGLTVGFTAGTLKADFTHHFVAVKLLLFFHYYIIFVSSKYWHELLT